MSTFHGRKQLGQTYTAAETPGILGDEFDTVVTVDDAASGMLVTQGNGRVRVKLLLNTSGGTLKPGSLVEMDATASNMEYSAVNTGAAEVPLAIVDPFLVPDVPVGAKFFGIVKASRTKILSGAAFAKGDRLESDANGKAIEDNVNATSIRALEAASGADELVDVACDFTIL